MAIEASAGRDDPEVPARSARFLGTLPAPILQPRHIARQCVDLEIDPVA